MRPGQRHALGELVDECQSRGKYAFSLAQMSSLLPESEIVVPLVTRRSRKKGWLKNPPRRVHAAVLGASRSTGRLGRFGTRWPWPEPSTLLHQVSGSRKRSSPALKDDARHGLERFHHPPTSCPKRVEPVQPWARHRPAMPFSHGHLVSDERGPNQRSFAFKIRSRLQVRVRATPTNDHRSGIRWPFACLAFM